MHCTLRQPALAASLGILLTAGGAHAQTLFTVGPGGTHSTIQAAVDAAVSGDFVEVLAGTYTEDVVVAGKGVRRPAGSPAVE